jgi:hypothetical protein
MIMVPPDAYDVTRNWLCHLDGLEIRDFILVVDSEMSGAMDFVSRGYLVYQTEKLTEAKSRSFMHMKLVHFLLSLNYDVVVANPYSIWFDKPFSKLIDSDFDLVSSQSTSFCDDIMGFRSTNSSVRSLERTLDHLENSGVKTGDGLPLGGSKESPSSILGENLIVKYAQFSPFKMRRDLNLSGDVVPITLSAHGGSKEQRVDFLNSVGLWIIDDFDFACKKVTCKNGFDIYH